MFLKVVAHQLVIRPTRGDVGLCVTAILLRHQIVNGFGVVDAGDVLDGE